MPLRKKDVLLSKYRIFETEEFRKKIDKLQSKDSKIVGKKLKEYAYPQLREEPFYGNNVKKLKKIYRSLS